MSQATAPLSLRMCVLVPRSVSTAVQAAVVAASQPFNPAVCAAAPLSHPLAERYTRQLYFVLAAAASWVGPALAPSPPTAAQQCAALLTWLRISIALLTPLTWQALSEAYLFRRHQAQRRHAGVAPERGVHAAAYSAVVSLSQGRGVLHTALVFWLGLVVSWTLSALVTIAMPIPVQPVHV